MKKIVAAAIALLVLLTVAPAETQAETDGLLVERRISVSPYGLVFVQDNVSKSSPGERLEIGVPRNMQTSLKDIQVLGAEMIGREDRDGYTYYALTPISNNFSIRYVYSGLIIARGENSYTLTTPTAPIIRGTSFESDIFIILPEDAQVSRTPHGFTLNGSTLIQKNIKSEQGQETITISFTSNSLHLVTGERVTLSYDLDLMLAIVQLKLRNDDLKNLNSITLDIPDSLQVLEVGDYSGALRHRVATGKLVVDIYPDRFEVKSGWRYEFFVKARIRGDSDLIKQNQRTITLKTFQALNATIEKFSFEAILPQTLTPSMTDLFSELYRDSAGRTVVRFRDELINAYSADRLIFEVTPSGASPFIPQILVLAALVLGAFSIITYSGALRLSRPRAAQPLSQAQGQTIIKELEELRRVLEEIEEIAGLEKGDARHVQIQPSISRLRSKYEAVRESFLSVRGSEQILRVARNLQENMSELGESLKVLSRSYSELQRGEISRSSYLKVYRALRSDIREFISSLTEAEAAIRELTKKG